MQFYKTDASTKAILAFNLFDMLGMTALDDADKDAFQERVQRLIVEYFLQEKLGESLTKAQLRELMRKFPPDNQKNVDAFMEEVGEILPDASSKFVDAIVEIKARIVRDHYETKKEAFEQLLKEMKDPKEQEVLKEKLAQCEVYLTYIDNNEWEFLAARANEAQEKEAPAK